MHVATDFTLVFSDVRATELQLSGGRCQSGTPYRWWFTGPSRVYRYQRGIPPVSRPSKITDRRYFAAE